MQDKEAIDELFVLLTSRTDGITRTVRQLVQESGILNFYSAENAMVEGDIDAVSSKLELELRQSISPMRLDPKPEALGIFQRYEDELVGAARQGLRESQFPASLLIVTILQLAMHKRKNSFLNVCDELKTLSALLDFTERETQLRCCGLIMQITLLIENSIISF